MLKVIQHRSRTRCICRALLACRGLVAGAIVTLLPAYTYADTPEPAIPHQAVLGSKVNVNEEIDSTLLADVGKVFTALNRYSDNANDVSPYVPLQIYLSHPDGDSVLRKVRIQLRGDGGDGHVEERIFSAQESRALSLGGMSHVATWWIAPGEYALSAKVIAEQNLQVANIPRINISASKPLHITTAPIVIELKTVRRSALFGLKHDTALAIEDRAVDDPGAEGARLRRAQIAFSENSGNDLLARIYRQALSSSSGHEPVSTNEEVIATAKGNVAADDGNSTTPTDNVAGSNGVNISTWYRQYQSGLSDLRNQREAEGLSQLMAIASTQIDPGSAASSIATLLQDRINAELGFYFLKTGRNLSAAERFRAVRRFSPYAEKALIGLGWALLRPVERQGNGDIPSAADTHYLWSGSEDYIAWARRNAPYRNAWSVGSGEKREDLRRAMSPWLELVAGNSLSAEVQEGLLVIPYALTHFGALDRAEERYSLAVSELRGASQRLHDLRQAIADGVLAGAMVSFFDRQKSGWQACLCGFESVDQDALSLLVEEPSFMMAVDALRQWANLRQHIAQRRQALLPLSESSSAFRAWVQQLDQLAPRVDDRIAVLSQRVNRVAESLVSQYIDRTDAYLAESRFALARLNERRRDQLLSYSQPGGRD